MNGALIETLANRVVETLSGRAVEIEASGRHVHLSRAGVEALFGQGYQLTPRAELSQPGQFACRERIAIQGPKRAIENVVILGPERGENQVEISATDATALGVAAPVRMSGQLAHTPGIKLAGPAGELAIGRGVIAAKRHIHLTPADAARLGIADRAQVSVFVPGERALTFHNVAVRVSPDFATYMHIDYDEANAAGHHKGMRGYILKPGEGAGLENFDALVKRITAEIMEREGGGSPERPKGQPDGRKRILVLGDDPGCSVVRSLEGDFAAEVSPNLSRAGEFDYVLLPASCFAKARDEIGTEQSDGGRTVCAPAGGALDWTAKKLVHEKELMDRCTAGMKQIQVGQKTIITQLAMDYLRKNAIAIERV